MCAFLPPEYDPPKGGGGHYFKPLDGENKIRILASPILGYVAWVEDQKGKRPVRARMTDPRPEGRDLKHFLALPIWDYASHSIKVYEITQQTIQSALTTLARSEDWGSPVDGNGTGYDLVITRRGSGLETEYGITPCPAKPLHPKISEEFNTKSINLDALYDGDDPFGEKDEPVQEQQQGGGGGAPDMDDDIPF